MCLRNSRSSSTLRGCYQPSRTPDPGDTRDRSLASVISVPLHLQKSRGTAERLRGGRAAHGCPLSVLGVAVVVFASTNIDDMFLLSAFFADATLLPLAVVVRQFLGIGALVLAPEGYTAPYSRA